MKRRMWKERSVGWEDRPDLTRVQRNTMRQDEVRKRILKRLKSSVEDIQIAGNRRLEKET